MQHGIYLDNAIEACLETANPMIHFHLGKMNQDTVFIISCIFSFSMLIRKLPYFC